MSDPEIVFEQRKVIAHTRAYFKLVLGELAATKVQVLIHVRLVTLFGPNLDFDGRNVTLPKKLTARIRAKCVINMCILGKIARVPQWLRLVLLVLAIEDPYELIYLL